MNKILQLKGKFQQRKNPNKPGPTNLPKDAVVKVEHLKNLCKELQDIHLYWKTNTSLIGGALISVHYKSVIAKSNRLKYLLSNGTQTPSDSIRGARFVFDPVKGQTQLRQKHVFTHFVSIGTIQNSINVLIFAIDTIENKFGQLITDKELASVNNGDTEGLLLSKSVFAKIVVDAFFVERFDIDKATRAVDTESIITIYKTGRKTTEILGQLGIDMINAKMIDDTTLRLNPEEIKLIQESAPYLIAMNVTDFSSITREAILTMDVEEPLISIPDPKTEPCVGVIDTQFDESVYFHKWVEYKNLLSPEFEITSEDREHGTAISSIIVDGPAFNPNLDDGCGRFRVKHFGVAKAGKFSSFTVLKLIRKIISENTDIKVWNLSLGSAMEVDKNFISPEAAELDRIQSEYDIIFVVAGTNKGKDIPSPYRIGAPADSLNSLVVNAVDFSGNSASYTRVGPVLSFFHKPDISYYGGDRTDTIVVCKPLGKGCVSGTSFAAPWITRKMAYLIYVMGLSKEIAKALVVDSAAGWNRMDNGSFAIGYGIVPKKIEDILYSKDDEIRFIMSGTIDEYETYTYNIPVPQDKKCHPFFAKATLVYFPKSDRNQGVDYTSTEMDVHFGRVKDEKEIKSIDLNRQSNDGLISIYEAEARKMYRKWDNVKHINEEINEKARPRKAYESGMWGLSIKTKERSSVKEGRGLRFGIVVTLKEMNGVNRIDEFMRMCMVRGWLVNQLDINTQIDVYNKAEETVDFE